MSENTKIEWCDHTFNPWEGCAKVSPGCANCYAETRNARWNGGEAPNWGRGAPRRRTSAANWRKPVIWNGNAKAFAAKHGRRQRVFCASLADWLDEEVPIEWLADLLDLIRITPKLDWLLLTKRPENWRRRLAQSSARMLRDVGEEGDSYTDEGYSSVMSWLRGYAPHNVWIGTTVEDQKRADERIPMLLQIPAKGRFLSCEPLLGPVEFSNVTHRKDWREQLGKRALEGINWVIAGGESGPQARPMHPDWARSLRDQCQAAGVPFFFKQWGEWAPHRGGDLAFNGANGEKIAASAKHAFAETILEPQVERMARVGKKAAGRLFDGREWNEFPEVER